ncbi:hypothetical protein GCM10017559_71870 [Streptosporangium longisporum]|uniref:RNA polymerase sigma-70 region 2 domain-containing protein n=1 Tax=Streptosporangium longisporum TaxID=46187 RepID=A0ABP6L8W9_9ACTN
MELAKSIEAGLFARTSDQRFVSRLGVPEFRELVWQGNAGQAGADRGNLRLVVSIAKEICGTRHALLDLIQEGNPGPSGRSRNSTNTKGYKFSTYATWWIRARRSPGRSRNQARNHSHSVHMVETINKL